MSEGANGHEPGTMVVCDSCDGQGKHWDIWGSWDCWLCQGKGFLLRSAWLAYIATFPQRVQDYWLANEPALYLGDARNAWVEPCRNTVPAPATHVTELPTSQPAPPNGRNPWVEPCRNTVPK